MTFLDKLDMLMAELDINKSKLSQLSGVPYTTIDGFYKKGYENAKISTITKIAKALGVSLDYLVESGENKKGHALSSEALRLARDYDGLDRHGRRTVRVVADAEIERISDVPAPVISLPDIRHYLTAAAAGYAAPIEGEDYELIPRGPEVPAGADYCIEVTGDSMEPYIRDGQRIYVQRDVPVDEFQPAVWYLDGDVYIKQWCMDHVGTVYLLSANPDREDANITIEKDSGRNLVCFGKVLLSRRLPRPVYR